MNEGADLKGASILVSNCKKRENYTVVFRRNKEVGLYLNPYISNHLKLKFFQVKIWSTRRRTTTNVKWSPGVKTHKKFLCYSILFKISQKWLKHKRHNYKLCCDSKNASKLMIVNLFILHTIKKCFFVCNAQMSQNERW